MSFKKNDILEVNIIDMTHEGQGVAKVDGAVIFVPMAAIDDVLMVKILKVNKKLAFAKIESIVKPSPFRTENDCEVYNQCGGCCYRHITYQSECDIKLKGVVENLKRIGGVELEGVEFIGATDIEHYRNKAQLPVARDDDGKIKAGFFARHSHRVINCDNCRLQPAIFNDITKAIKDYLVKKKISVYNETTHTGLVRHIYIREAKATSQIMVAIVINGKSLFNFDKLKDYLKAKYPVIKTVLLLHNTEKTNVILGNKSENPSSFSQEDNIVDVLCGKSFSISPLSFYQVNHDMAEKLYLKIAEFADLSGEQTLIDMYCGAGTIGISLSDKVKSLIGVEIVKEACDDAYTNAALNQVQNVHFHNLDASEGCKLLKNKDVTADVVVLDPPRKGCDNYTLEAITIMNPDKIIMVSCNSATLARDVKFLSDFGYTAKKVCVVDLFPRTAHVESVVLMSKVQN